MNTDTTTDLKRGSKIWFKSLPKTEESKPNAEYCRPISELNGERVHEILYHGEKWIVRESEILSADGAFAAAAKQFHELIEARRRPGQSRDDWAKACGFSIGTLRNRMAFVQNHLVKNEASLQAK